MAKRNPINSNPPTAISKFKSSSELHPPRHTDSSSAYAEVYYISVHINFR